jgi:indolepyruvate ferredoxin oxidoreductase
VDYQDEALADRFAGFVERARHAESAVGADETFTRTVARALFKTLAYKDEYEVARLHAQSSFIERLREDYGDGARLRFHLAPPLLSRETDARGRPRKREFGAWMLPVFRLLAKMKGLRGTRLDVFGMTDERRMERALIAELEGQLEEITGNLTAANIGVATEIVAEYLEIRGFGPVKETAAEGARKRIREKIETFRQVRDKAA